VKFAAPITDEGWGLVTRMDGPAPIMLYRPMHQTPTTSDEGGSPVEGGLIPGYLGATRCSSPPVLWP
jgi:hypothetical protein